MEQIKNFGLKQEKAFEEQKKALTSDPVIHIFIQEAKLELYIDAGSFMLRSVLL